MILGKNISNLVGNHVPPYHYKNFKEGDYVHYAGMYWDNREAEAAIDSFLNGTWITAGDNVNKFERAFSEKFKSGYSLMVNSGSSANLVMITALKKYYGWQDNDEIIVSPVGFATTISVIYQNRLNPVFVDIEQDTLNFDLDILESKITEHTRAVFLSPVLGNPPDMDKLISICERHHLRLILDSCDSLGTRWNGKYLNEYAVASSFSFYPAHHISTGEGGMISTNDKRLNQLMTSIAWWGRDCHCIGVSNLLIKGSCGKRFDFWLKNYNGVVDHKYVFSNMGYNLKPLDLQGAIGLVQLDKFDEIEQRRKESKHNVERILLKIDGIKSVETHKLSDVCWFGTPFIYDEKNRLVRFLEDNKIQTRNYFAGNILLHPGFDFLGDWREYPVANKVLDNVFFLGAAPHYTNEVFEYIEKVINKYISQKK